MTILDPLNGGTDSRAVGINVLGQVAGYSNTATSNFWRGFVRDHMVADIGTLGGEQAVPAAIGPHGEVAGSSLTGQIGPTGAVEHGFFYAGGVMQDLGVFEPVAMNKSLQMVGTEFPDAGDHHAFI